jgi:hypothetical protein
MSPGKGTAGRTALATLALAGAAALAVAGCASSGAPTGHHNLLNPGTAPAAPATTGCGTLPDGVAGCSPVVLASSTPTPTFPSVDKPKARPKPQPPAPTVVYVVNGSPADVTYGPAGSDAQGTVPMRVSAPLASPVYYAITAQLQGGGVVTCKLKIDGQVISAAAASGGYNIASCEADQNPLTGAWENTNAG